MTNRKSQPLSIDFLDGDPMQSAHRNPLATGNIGLDLAIFFMSVIYVYPLHANQGGYTCIN
ncbi:hypothetical protein ALQ79_200086 [Pseudomonas amygdali pv. lachrymans]|nr:hypothetical protein ALQ79_200086 [Pseudomonas amygdali pv. lachrymans]